MTKCQLILALLSGRNHGRLKVHPETLPVSNKMAKDSPVAAETEVFFSGGVGEVSSLDDERLVPGFPVLFFRNSQL